MSLQRKIRKGFRRARSLFGRHFFRYTGNRLRVVWYNLTKSTKVAMPRTVMLELSANCNLRCTICPREFQYGKEMDMGYMDPKLAYNLLDQMLPYLDSIALTGLGETLMFKEIGEVATYIKEKNPGVQVFISTNATYKISRLESLIGKIDTLQISTDGIGEVYEKIRRPTTFALFEKNVAEITKLFGPTNTEVMLNMVVTKENYIHMQEVIAFALKHKVNRVQFTMFNVVAANGISGDYYSFYRGEEFQKEVARAKEYQHTSANNVEIEFEAFGAQRGFQSCPFPWNMFYISWDGNLPPCCAKPFPKVLNFGDVKTEKLFDVFNSKPFREFREKWLKNETPEFCKNCHIADLPPIKV